MLNSFNFITLTTEADLLIDVHAHESQTKMHLLINGLGMNVQMNVQTMHYFINI